MKTFTITFEAEEIEDEEIIEAEMEALEEYMAERAYMSTDYSPVITAIRVMAAACELAFDETHH